MSDIHFPEFASNSIEFTTTTTGGDGDGAIHVLKFVLEKGAQISVRSSTERTVDIVTG